MGGYNKINFHHFDLIYVQNHEILAKIHRFFTQNSRDFPKKKSRDREEKISGISREIPGGKSREATLLTNEQNRVGGVCKKW